MSECLTLRLRQPASITLATSNDAKLALDWLAITTNSTRPAILADGGPLSFTCG